MNILATRLNHWSEENRVLDESQAGFRQKYSTIDNVFNLMALVQKYLSKKKRLSIAYLLISKRPLTMFSIIKYGKLLKEITLMANICRS